MNNKEVLKVQNLTKKYSSKIVVNNINFSIEEGDIFGFLGPNGAGKTTTIKMILNLINKDKGKVYVNGKDLSDNFNECISKIGAVVETPKFYEYLTGYQNLKQIANLEKNVNNAKIMEVLKIVRMEKRAKEKVQTYSLGMKQRLGLARALLNNPKLIILDEPTNGLDPQGMKDIRELIKKLSVENNITFLISTHLLHEVEQICNKVAILKEGEIVSYDTVQNLLNKNTETLNIQTPDILKTLSLLKSLGYVKNKARYDKGVIIEIEKGFSIELNKYLIKKGINMEYSIPVNQSLEEFFIEKTKGGEQIA
ncbi:MAG: ABC transporter ATP-binding protein [Bacillota bacterium]|nr:ABC transporter ATP-binding protein [Bacillota bacterium]